jgi:hypothetical protein
VKRADLLQRLDRVCAKMNGGMAAMATVLGACVIVMALVRGSEMQLDWQSSALSNSATAHAIETMGWGYN